MCWLSQQSAEKALKAILIHLQKNYPRTHDLDALNHFLPPEWTVKERSGHFAALSEWAVESRYPGDWPEPTRDNAETAANQAEEIFSAVREDFGKIGIQITRTD